jgi:TonB-dependent receptor
MDKDYDDEGFLDGKYTLGPFADLDKMNQLFTFFKQNWGWAPYHEFIMHHFHKTQSLIYDYSGTETYNAKYVMSDLNIGTKLNLVTGVRIEENRTKYTSYHGQQTTLPHYNSMGSDTVSNHIRTNSYSLPALFVRYQPLDWLILRYASTNTLTRPNYSDIIPLYNINGSGRAVEYRNPFLEPGLSENNDYVVSFNNKHLGLLSFSYFTKKIEGLIFSSGQRYITDASLYGLPGFTETYRINNYKANNPYEVTLDGFEIDYQTRFWYLPRLLRGLVFNANYTRTNSEVKYPRTVIETKVIFDPSFQVITQNLDSLYVDRLLDQPRDIINLSLGYDYKGFSGRLSMNYISNVFSTTNFWPGLREDTDAYRRYDLSMKQKLPVKGLELYLNISNLTEAVDITRLRGYNPYDKNFDDSIYEEILDPALFSYYDPDGGENGEGARVGLNPDIADLLSRVPRDQRAKSQEQHYGSTIDLGFRFAF